MWAGEVKAGSWVHGLLAPAAPALHCRGKETTFLFPHWTVAELLVSVIKRDENGAN